jgi:hypothetical protein
VRARVHERDGKIPGSGAAVAKVKYLYGVDEGFEALRDLLTLLSA